MNVRTDDGLTNGANVIELVHLQLIGKPSGIIWVFFDHADKRTKKKKRHWPTVDID